MTVEHRAERDAQWSFTFCLCVFGGEGGRVHTDDRLQKEKKILPN